MYDPIERFLGILIYVAMILAIIGILWVEIGTLRGDISAQQPSITKNITVMDKAQIDDWYLIYTTDHEIFSVKNIFLFREIAVNETYVVEYKPGRKIAYNAYGADGHIMAFTIAKREHACAE